MSKGPLLWPRLLLLIVAIHGKPVSISVPELCQKVSRTMIEGSSVHIPLHTIETSFHVYHLDRSTSRWEEILASFNGISQPLHTSYAEMISVSSRGFEVEHVSRGAAGSYQVISTVSGECVAHIDLGVLAHGDLTGNVDAAPMSLAKQTQLEMSNLPWAAEPTPPPPVWETPPLEKEDLSGKGGSLGDSARFALVVAGVILLEFLLFLLAVYLTLPLCVQIKEQPSETVLI